MVPMAIVGPIGSLEDENGELTTESIEKAYNLLNQYFSSVFSYDNGSTDTSSLPSKVKESDGLDAVSITQVSIFQYIRN